MMKSEYEVCKYRKRTQPQNRIFHAKVNEIAKALDENREWLEMRIKLFACERGYPFEIVGGVAYPFHSSEVCISDFKILIDSTYEWAFDHGIYIE